MLAGNSHAGVYVLDLLLEVWRRDDILVIAAPETKRHDWQPSLAARAAELEVPCLVPARVNDDDVVQAVADHQADLLLSVYYTQIFSAPLLEAITGARLNFHPALLPKHRGTAPLIWAIAEGDTMAGLSVHEITLGVDTGDLLWQRVLPIHPEDTGYSLQMKAAALARATAAELIRCLVQGRPLPPPQRQTGTATHHTSRDPQLNQIDWDQPAAKVRNIVRALAHPLPGAYMTVGSRRIGVEWVEPRPTRTASRSPGMVEYDSSGSPTIWSADAPVAIEAIRFEGELLSGSTLRKLGVQEGDFAS